MSQHQQQLIRKSSSSSADCDAIPPSIDLFSLMSVIWFISRAIVSGFIISLLSRQSVRGRGKQVALNRWKRSRAAGWPNLLFLLPSQKRSARLVSRKEMSLFCDKPNRNQRFSKKWWICWWWCKHLRRISARQRTATGNERLIWIWVRILSLVGALIPENFIRTRNNWFFLIEN